jgi:hypothetical protein
VSGQGKVLASTTIALLAILISTFAMTWFRMHIEVTGDLGLGQAAALLTSARVQIGLHSATACMPDGTCTSMPLSNFDGLGFGLIVAYQAVQRVLVGQAGEALSRVGYIVVILALGGAFLTGFMFAPETGANELAKVIVHRTWAPGLMMFGYISGVVALVMSTVEDEMPSTAMTLPIATARPAPRAVISEPIVPIAKSRVVTSDPTITAVTIARAEPEPVIEPEPLELANTALAPVVTVPPAAATPPQLYRQLKYATARALFGGNGIEAEREDGTKRTVLWPDVVGVVARRLPAEAPCAGETFVDLVSIAGATLRFLPWTEISGAPIDGALATGDESERARTFVQLIAMACPEARLDSATRTFLGGRGLAAQLSSIAMLAQHDDRLA